MIDVAVIVTALGTDPPWCVWKLDTEGKKRPFRLDKPAEEAKVNESAGWGSFDEARRVFEAGRFEGVGRKLGDGISGIDIDDCRNPETGALTTTARQIIDELSSYTEISPSGTGVKIFVRAYLGRNHAKPGLEIYGGRRYFTVTGQHLAGTPATVEDRSEQLAALVAREFKDDDRTERIAPRNSTTKHLTDVVIAEGGRSNWLASELGKLRRIGYSDKTLTATGQALNIEHCKPPLDRLEVETIARSVARYKPADDTFPLTETGDAEFFASVFGDRVRFDHRRGRFLLFTEHRWTPDPDGELHRLATESIRLRHEAALLESQVDAKKRRVTWAVNGESRRRLENALSLSRSQRPISDAGADWDRDPFLMAVPNGVIDLRSGELRAGRADDRITISASVPFDADASCSLWERTIAEVFKHDDELIAYIQRAIGYSLTGDCREECLFLCWGDGRNGKGTLMNTIGWVLGDYADDLPFSALEWHDGAGIPNDIAKLVAKRFATASESGDTVRLNEARIKALTGRDPITARFLHREYFTFQPEAKFWLATNKKPIVRDDSEGFWSRIHFIPFTQSFAGREDKALKDKLRAEGAGILAWAIRGCLAWQRDGLNPPAIVRNATNEYRRESEPLTPFFDDCCVIDEGCRTQAADLYRAYQNWSAANHLKDWQRLSQKAFGVQVRKRFKADERRQTWFLGVGLRASGFGSRGSGGDVLIRMHRLHRSAPTSWFFSRRAVIRERTRNVVLIGAMVALRPWQASDARARASKGGPWSYGSLRFPFYQTSPESRGSSQLESGGSKSEHTVHVQRSYTAATTCEIEPGIIEPIETAPVEESAVLSRRAGCMFRFLPRPPLVVVTPRKFPDGFSDRIPTPEFFLGILRKSSLVIAQLQKAYVHA